MFLSTPMTMFSTMMFSTMMLFIISSMMFTYNNKKWKCRFNCDVLVRVADFRTKGHEFRPNTGKPTTTRGESCASSPILWSFCTANLNKKNLPTKSPWDFEPIFDIKHIYWHVPCQKFVIQCRVTRWRCNHFVKKWPKWNLDTTLSIKKTCVTPNFCKRNFSLIY